MAQDHLIALIENQQGSELHSYVLIDPLAVPARSDHSILDQLRSVLGESALTSVLRTDLAHAPHLHPVLVCLACPGATPLNSLLQITAQAAFNDLRRRKRQICGWLFSEASPPEIAHHLASLCQIPNAAGKTDFYPVYEPLRFELFASAFDAINKGPWWPIKHWLFLTSGGMPARVHGLSRSRSFIPTHAVELQQDAHLIQAFLAVWQALLAGPSSLQKLPQIPAMAAEQACHPIQQARQLGLSTQDDIITLMLHQLCLHPNLQNHPAIAKLIETAAQGQRPLAELFAQYTDADWKHFTATLPPSEVTAFT